MEDNLECRKIRVCRKVILHHEQIQMFGYNLPVQNTTYTIHDYQQDYYLGDLNY